MHGKARQLDRKDWIVVEHTHEAIIPEDQWRRVQSLLKRDTRALDFVKNLSPFAGFLRCGDCGRAMSKTNHPHGVYYCCGSYKRYGPTVCTRHGISHRDLETLVLDDLNKIIASVEDLHSMAEDVKRVASHPDPSARREKLRASLERIYRLKKSAYEDFREGLLEKEDYLRYKADYDRQEKTLSGQLKQIETEEQKGACEPEWITELLSRGRLTELDRATVAETIREIQVFEDRVEISYIFSDELGILSQEEVHDHPM